MKKNKKNIVYYKHISLKPRKIINLQGKSIGFTISKFDVDKYKLSKGDIIRPILFYKNMKDERPLPFSKIVCIGNNLGVHIALKIMKEQKLEIGMKVQINLQIPCYEYNNDVTEGGKKIVFIFEKRDGLKLRYKLDEDKVSYTILK